MTIRTNSVQQCDRCLKPFKEAHLKAGDAVPAFKQKGLVVTETTGTNKEEEPKYTVLFSFDDLCPACEKAVDGLLKKLRLDGATAKKSRKRRSKKKTEETPPKPPEYTEDPPAEAEAEPAEEPPAEKPGPDGEPAASEGEPQESQESKDTTDEDFEEAAKQTDADVADAEATESSDGGNGAEAGSDDNLVEDPATGDKYDPETGEVVVRGDKGQNGAPEKHPF